MLSLCSACICELNRTKSLSSNNVNCALFTPFADFYYFVFLLLLLLLLVLLCTFRVSCCLRFCSMPNHNWLLLSVSCVFRLGSAGLSRALIVAWFACLPVCVCERACACACMPYTCWWVTVLVFLRVFFFFFFYFFRSLFQFLSSNLYDALCMCLCHMLDKNPNTSIELTTLALCDNG